MRKLQLLIIVAFFTIPAAAQILFTISENVGENFMVGNVLARSGLKSKYDTSRLRTLQYTLMSRGSLPTDYFKINNKTSELFIAKAIDRDNLCDLVMICCDFDTDCDIPLSILVQPTSGAFFVETIKLRVQIIDENDNMPTFQQRSIQGHISELADVGSTVTLPSNGNPLLANDRDRGSNSVTRYSIISPTGTFGLIVDNDYGVISDVAIVTQKKLDREKVSTYKIVVMAHDGGKPPKSGSVTVDIIVDDFNDNIPKFSNDTYSVQLSETAPINSSVIKVRATDADSGLNAKINYSIKNRPSDIVTRLFTINPMTGEIRTKGRLNFEMQKQYRIKVQAADEGPIIQRKSTATVIVKLLDENDHGPVIKPSYLSKSDRPEVSESAPIGTFVAIIVVTDPDDDEVNCFIDSPMFRLRRSPSDENEFYLVTAHKLNREKSASYDITLSCIDDGQPQMRTDERLTVYILDANDHPPVFLQSTYTASVTENNDLDVFVLQVRAEDKDTGENARIIYSLNEDGDGFSINSASGRIYTQKVFNREEYDQIRFKVLARDNATEPLYTETNVIIRIEDENDNAPQFVTAHKFEISEAAGIGVMLGQMTALDPDIGLNAQVTFSLAPNRDSRSFSITKSGLISTAKELDREVQELYHLKVIASDHGLVVHSSSTTVTIEVTDINDNPPQIHFPNPYNNTVYLSYLEAVGYTVTCINATDVDAGRNALLEYSFTRGNELNVFNIVANTGAVKLAKRLQKQDAIVYKLRITVMDNAEPYHSTTEILNIVVDGTGKAIARDGTYLDSMASNRNLIIVICLAAVSAVLAVILIVAIICIRRTDRDHHLYNVQTETHKVDEQRHGPLADKVADHSPVRRTVSYSTEVDDSYAHVNGLQSPVYSSLRSQNWKSSVYPKPIDIGTKV